MSAQEIKELVRELLVEANHNGHPVNIDQEGEALLAVHAAIDAQAAEIESLRANATSHEVKRLKAELVERAAEIERLKEHAVTLANSEMYVERQRNAEEIERLKEELETERIRLAACGVIALSNTRDEAAKQRAMKPEYWSASAGDVARAVDREMDLREAQAQDAEHAAMFRWVRDSAKAYVTILGYLKPLMGEAFEVAVREAMGGRGMAETNPNTGHGHVRVRPDGVKARCGGPGFCSACNRELAISQLGLPRVAPPTDADTRAAMKGGE
jgi:hypothetical protein